MRLWEWELDKENAEGSRTKQSLCNLNLLFIFSGVITATAQPDLPGSTLPFLRNLDVFLSLHLGDRVQKKATKIDRIFSLHA